MASGKKRRDNPTKDSSLTKKAKLICCEDDDAKENNDKNDVNDVLQRRTLTPAEIITYIRNKEPTACLYHHYKTILITKFQANKDLCIVTLSDIFRTNLLNNDLLTIFLTFYDDIIYILLHEFQNTFFTEYNARRTRRISPTMSARRIFNSILNLNFVNKPISDLQIKTITNNEKYEIKINGFLNHSYMIINTKNHIIVQEKCSKNCLDTNHHCLRTDKNKIKWTPYFVSRGIGRWRVTGKMYIVGLYNLK